MLGAGKAKRLARAGDVESLINLLANGKRRERHAAARTLGELGDPRAVEPLIAALERSYGEDEDLALIVVAALGNFRDPRVTETFTTLLAERKDDGFYFLPHRAALFALADLETFEPLEEVARDETRNRVLRGEAKALLRKRATRG
jgi:HEAT repeat protein